ncbi:HAD family hydrolase [Sphingomonas abietis]|uniref:HAD family phosphatase n=1 Tax=Sphingomonas abietis TaxID=3012344 RepID=A0ABY7NLM9_9SPHN|nr:HAD family phosphatase [Sphingomonas abietis]WBO20819.1 HAD family phosphatase [Sphingomonas abietis]
MHGPERLLAGRRLFIFDLDGTLADSSPIHAAAFATVLAPRGIAVDYPAIAGMATAPAMRHLLALAGQQPDDAELAALVAAKRAAARQALVGLREIAGAGAFVACAARHHRLALCTSAARVTADATLAVLGLADRFETIVTADDVAKPKPDAEAFLAVLDRAGVAAADALIFEDSEAGLAAAHAAGIDAIRIGEGAADWPRLTLLLDGAAA